MRLTHTVLLSSILFGACAPGPDSEATANEACGGTIVVGMPQDVRSLNPLATISIHDFLVQQHVLYTPLFRLDDRLEPVPALVERWDTTRIAGDSLALTLQLRAGVSWHDGHPTTAADVQFTFERAMDPRTAFPQAALLRHFDPVAELLDEHRIRFRMREHADFLARLASLIPAPAHLLRDTPAAEIAHHPFSRRPVGNGPFRFERGDPGSRYEFVANLDHPAELGGPPSAERLILRVIPDATTRLAELLTGAVDVVVSPAPAHAAEIRRHPDLELHASPGLASTLLVWNGRQRPFDDPRVRRALTLAIDRQEVVDAALQGEGTAGTTMARPVDWMYWPDAALAHDPAAAARLLDEAGWIRNGDGVRMSPAGDRLSFEIVSLPEMRDLIVVVQAQLRRVGVEMRPRLLEPRALDRMVDGETASEGGRSRSFQAAAFEVTMFAKDDAPLLHSRFRDDPWGAAGYADERVDHILDQLPFTLRRDDSLPLWIEYQEHTARDAPITTLMYPHTLVAARSTVGGIELGAGGEFVSVARWSPSTPD